ncbi:hypothetical protein KY334_07335, partial [Candidatus Woesearchaeota archaeon]|nr:hypothetical protein [Candidatus Woesearchaeota archaeon]
MKQGFFDLGTGYDLDILKNHTKKKNIGYGCDFCDLYKSNSEITPIGKGKKKILILFDDTRLAKDQSIHLINILYQYNINIEEDCIVTSSVRCSCKEITSNYIINCRANLIKLIKDFSPLIILCFGVYALQSLIGHKIKGRLKNTQIKSFFSYQIPDQDYKCWLCPIMLIDNEEKDKVLINQFDEDVEKAIELLDIEFPINNYKEKCFIMKDKQEAINWLDNLYQKQPEYVVFDYETTGIKPHKEGHKIICCSISFNNQVYSFPFFEDHDFQYTWKSIMKSGGIKKIAHKNDFENLWTNEKLHIWINDWEWDTCLAEHCLRNNKPTNLKFLTYVHFGIIGYDDGIDNYISGLKDGEDSKSANRFNKIEQAPLEKLLQYNAYDSYFSMLLYLKQKKEMDKYQLKGFKLFLKGSLELCKIQQNGINICESLLKNHLSFLKRRMNKLEELILNSEESKKWLNLKRSQFNFNSNVQLSELLYNILKYKKPNGPKTNEKALNKIGIPFTNKILRWKKLKKLRDTYLAQFERESINNRIHPFFNLHLVSTFRSSSSNPNFQNIPIRNENSNRIRSIIIPRKGNRLIGYDYKSLEVCIGACYHKDPEMIKYITDPSTDMHRDTAIDLFFRMKEDFENPVKKEQMRKERYIAKNGFVFPSFYGSTSKIWNGKEIGEITQNIWEGINEKTKLHLKSNGIKSIFDFQKHVEEIEDRFWNEKFQIYNEWKQKIWKDYQQKNYVELYTGF